MATKISVSKLDPLALLNLEQLAELTLLSTNAARKAIAAGFLPRPVHIGRVIRFRAGDVQAWLSQGSMLGPATTTPTGKRMGRRRQPIGETVA